MGGGARTRTGSGRTSRAHDDDDDDDDDDGVDDDDDSGGGGNGHDDDDTCKCVRDDDDDDDDDDHAFCRGRQTLQARARDPPAKAVERSPARAPVDGLPARGHQDVGSSSRLNQPPPSRVAVEGGGSCVPRSPPRLGPGLGLKALLLPPWASAEDFTKDEAEHCFFENSKHQGIKNPEPPGRH